MANAVPIKESEEKRRKTNCGSEVELQKSPLHKQYTHQKVKFWSCRALLGILERENNIYGSLM